MYLLSFTTKLLGKTLIKNYWINSHAVFAKSSDCRVLISLDTQHTRFTTFLIVARYLRTLPDVKDLIILYRYLK